MPDGGTQHGLGVFDAPLPAQDDGELEPCADVVGRRGDDRLQRPLGVGVAAAARERERSVERVVHVRVIYQKRSPASVASASAFAL